MPRLIDRLKLLIKLLICAYASLLTTSRMTRQTYYQPLTLQEQHAPMSQLAFPYQWLTIAISLDQTLTRRYRLENSKRLRRSLIRKKHSNRLGESTRPLPMPEPIWQMPKTAKQSKQIRSREHQTLVQMTRSM